jgi:hypothetical protein
MLKTRAAARSSEAGMWNTSRKAVTSSRVTCPSALAIFAPSAITAMVKATERSGAVRNRSKTAVSPSPLASAASASDMRLQIDMGTALAQHRGRLQGEVADKWPRPAGFRGFSASARGRASGRTSSPTWAGARHGHSRGRRERAPASFSPDTPAKRECTPRAFRSASITAISARPSPRPCASGRRWMECSNVWA